MLSIQVAASLRVNQQRITLSADAATMQVQNRAGFT